MFEQAIAQKLNINIKNVAAVIRLLEEGSSIPFIARYRKDMTGALDEVQIQAIQDEKNAFTELEERRSFIEKAIESQGKMTPTLLGKIRQADNLTMLEDLYLPYKQKRKTKADTARENGLEPLALFLLEQTNEDPELEAASFINEKVLGADSALQGARDIIAEMINEDLTVRDKLRKLFETEASISSVVNAEKAEDAQKFKDYFEYSEKISRIPSHRILAILRGFLEGHLRMAIEPVLEEALDIIESLYIKRQVPAALHISKAARDAYKRLLQPSLESEFRATLKKRADEEAITVFAENLRQLLLAAPLGSKPTLAIDPGYRTGCKVVCLDEKAELAATSLIYVHEKNRLAEAAQCIRRLVKEHKIEAISIGDGTAGRETEQFIKGLDLGLPVFLVNEDGASIYSASEIARKEFPDQDITIRGAVSIGRRLMDPLAELVKIDPKSIGVGQYQHDVNQPRLKERLDQTVTSCVNMVGVNINTASSRLLSYVSGMTASLAENIIQYRSLAGKFKSRKELLKVARLGEKAFEQCAGFLRIKDGEELLDGSAVHPEAYPIVQQIANDLRVSTDQLIGNEKLLNDVAAKNYVTATAGVHSIEDIIRELKKPGLDPRSQAQTFEFAQIFSMEDVKPGMEVPGIVTNLTRFGAFVDIGVKQDGLVHVSEISHRFIKDPSEVLKLNQHVRVSVIEVDIPRKRINLSIKQVEKTGAHRTQPPATRTSSKPSTPPGLDNALAALKQKFSK